MSKPEHSCSIKSTHVNDPKRKTPKTPGVQLPGKLALIEKQQLLQRRQSIATIHFYTCLRLMNICTNLQVFMSHFHGNPCLFCQCSKNEQETVLIYTDRLGVNLCKIWTILYLNSRILVRFKNQNRE